MCVLKAIFLVRYSWNFVRMFFLDKIYDKFKIGPRGVTRSILSKTLCALYKPHLPSNVHETCSEYFSDDYFYNLTMGDIR